MQSESGLGLVEQMDDIMEAGNRRQVAAIRLEILADEAGQEVEIGRLVGGQSHRKASCDLGKVLLVPVGTTSVERWGDDHLKANEKLIRNNKMMDTISSTNNCGRLIDLIAVAGGLDYKVS